MTYQVKEIFYTLQGEGARAGRAAVFLRFAGCNLWSGREVDRATATCQFCDTDFESAVRTGQILAFADLPGGVVCGCDFVRAAGELNPGWSLCSENQFRGNLIQ